MRRQRFERASGDIGASRIEHGVVIGERNVAQELPIIVDVEGRPAAVLRLHGEKPVERTVLAGLLGFGIGGTRMREAEHHHGGIVDIGIVVVTEFKGPAGGFRVGPFH